MIQIKKNLVVLTYCILFSQIAKAEYACDNVNIMCASITLSSGNEFVSQLLSAMSSIGVSEIVGRIDHLAFQTGSMAEFESMPETLRMTFGAKVEFLATSQVGEKFYQVFKLPVPFNYAGGNIHFLEVISPKIGLLSTSYWQHAEVVVDNLESIKHLYPNVKFDFSSVNRQYNPELKLNFENSAQQKLQLKWHLEDIDKVLKTSKFQQWPGLPPRELLYLP